MRPAFLIVFLKEARETVRDRRAIAILALLALLYPLVLGFMLKHQINNYTKPEREGIALTVIGGEQAPTLMAQLRQKNAQITRAGPMNDAAIGALLASHKAVAVLRLGEAFGANYAAMRPARVELWYDSAADNASKQRDIEDVLHEYSSSIASARLLAHGVSPATLAPLQLQRYDTGSGAARSASVIGTILGALFIPAFIFCLSTAIDGTAGERERRSLEVLLAQPARPFDLIAGKWLAAGLMSIVGLSLELMMAQLILQWLPLEEIGMSWRLDWLDLIVLCIVSIPLSLCAAACEIALAMNARSFKEAQTTVNLAVIAAIAPGMVVSMLNLKTANWMYLVPLLSNQTLVREMAKGQALGVLPYLLTFGSALLLALAALWFSGWRLQSERYILSV